MGWWKTKGNNVIGDPPLEVLEAHSESYRWKTPDNIPSEVMTLIANTYRDGLDRAPSRAELEALLAFHQGDASLGVIAGIKPIPKPNDP